MADGDGTNDAQGTGEGTDGGQGLTDEERAAQSQGDSGAGADGQGSGGGDDNDTDDPRVKRANREAAGYRRQLREEQQAREALEARLKALEKGKEGEPDVAAQLAEERQAREAATERVRKVSLKAEVATLAPAVKLADVDTALALLKTDELEWKDDQPTTESVKDALEALLELKPFLVVKEATPPGTAKSGTGGTAGAAGSGGKAPAETDDQRRARLRGAGSTSVWDPETAARLGGGVVQP